METEIEYIKKWLGAGSINIFGLPFSGKDTHSSELAKFFGASLIGGGDILRSAARPKHIQDHMAKGHLAPTDEYLAIVLPYLSREEFQDRPMVLSSVGRWHGEQDSVIEAAKKSGHPIKAVIYLSVTENEVYKRWGSASRGREDDAARHIIDKRIQEYIEKTEPVVHHYRELGLMVEVDGKPPQAVVTADLIRKLYNFAKKH